MNLSGYLLLEQSDFLSNYVGFFQQLRGDKDLFDVTLACEDETMEAHKVVLSACSIFFRNVFKKAKQKHPFIYLKGVLHKDLVALLDYIYTGQAQVLSEDVDRFFQVGKDMRVKGLIDEEQEGIDNIKKKVNTDSKTEELPDDSYDTTDVDESINSLSNDSSLVETCLEIKKEEVKIDVKNPDQLRTELSEKMEKIKDEEGMPMWKCKECGKMMKNRNKLELHVEIHLQGYSRICSHCGKTQKNRGCLKAHISAVHRGTK